VLTEDTLLVEPLLLLESLLVEPLLLASLVVELLLVASPLAELLFFEPLPVELLLVSDEVPEPLVPEELSVVFEPEDLEAVRVVFLTAAVELTDSVLRASAGSLPVTIWTKITPQASANVAEAEATTRRRRIWIRRRRARRRSRPACRLRSSGVSDGPAAGDIVHLVRRLTTLMSRASSAFICELSKWSKQDI
jgi:hypothetical protein